MSLPFDGPRDLFPEMREGDRGVLMPAIRIGVVMTALADGVLDLAEKNAIVDLFYSANRGDISPQGQLEMIQALVDMHAIVDESHVAAMFERARGLSEESKRQVLEACRIVAMLDNRMDQREETTIAKIAAWIDAPSE